MVLLKKVVVAEMQGSGGTDVFSTFKKFTTLQPAKQEPNSSSSTFLKCQIGGFGGQFTGRVMGGK